MLLKLPIFMVDEWLKNSIERQSRGKAIVAELGRWEGERWEDKEIKE